MRPRVSVALSDDKLVQLYHNRLPIRLICNDYEIGEYALHRAWAALKTEGKIKHGRRLVDRTDTKLCERAPVSDQDGRPTVGDDELLDKLFEVHHQPR